MRTIKMKRSFALVIAVAIVFTAAPANAKCKFNVDTIHSRTGEPMLWTKWNTFKLANQGDFPLGSGISIGDQKYFAMRITQSASYVKEEMDSALVIPDGASLLIKLDDATILELHSDGEVIGDVDGGRAEAVVRYAVDAGTLNALLTKRIMNIRLQTNQGNKDYAFGKKGSKRLQKTLACIK